MIKYFLIIFIITISFLIIKDSNKIKVVDKNYNITYIVDYSKLSVLKKPTQEDIKPLMINLNGIDLLLKDKYYGKFKIIRKENYYLDENSDIVPFDLILGWDKMSILDNINLIQFSQSNRWYYWNISSFDEITRSDIEENSANTHIIPYNKDIENKLKIISIPNDVILVGYLVDIKKDEKTWSSSETRTDTGGGACEIFLVTDVKSK